MDKLEKGFLYIVFGESFIKEALMSIKSLKRFNDAPVAMYTDVDYNSSFDGLVDIHRKISPQHIRAKVDYITETPFQKTVYLDSDTVIVRDISDMFDVLDRFDVAVTNDYARKRKKYSSVIPEYEAIPYSFSEVNGGIMAYNSSKESVEFLELWKKYFYKYYAQTNGWDQVSLRVSLWESSVRLHHFPFEYNIRSVGNREKQDRFKHEFGEQHMAPRIYHLHYAPEVHHGKFSYSIDEFDEYEKNIISQAVKY